MPAFKGFVVQVANDQNEPLPEYKILRHVGLTRSRPSTCTCYIESKAGEAFRITIEPLGVTRREDAWPPALIQKPAQIDEFGRVHPGDFYPNPANTHFLATLYLDGRPSAEKRILIYVDPSHPDFTDFAIMKRRRYWDPEDEQLKECTWVFKDIGIEHLLAQLTISPSKAESTEDGSGEIDNDVAKAFEELKLDGPAMEKTRIGCIEITLEEVRVFNDDFVYTPRPLDHGEDASATAIGKGLSHTVARTPGQVADVSMSSVCYAHVAKDRPPFAKFTFFYRSADILKKMCAGVPNAQGTGSKKKGEGSEGPEKIAGVKRAGRVGSTEYKPSFKKTSLDAPK